MHISRGFFPWCTIRLRSKNSLQHPCICLRIIRNYCRRDTWEEGEKCGYNERLGKYLWRWTVERQMDKKKNRVRFRSYWSWFGGLEGMHGVREFVSDISGLNGCWLLALIYNIFTFLHYCFISSCVGLTSENATVSYYVSQHNDRTAPAAKDGSATSGLISANMACTFVAWIHTAGYDLPGLSTRSWLRLLGLSRQWVWWPRWHCFNKGYSTIATWIWLSGCHWCGLGSVDRAWLAWPEFIRWSPTFLAWACQTGLNWCGLGGYRASRWLRMCLFPRQRAGKVAALLLHSWELGVGEREPKQTTVIASHMPSWPQCFNCQAKKRNRVKGKERGGFWEVVIEVRAEVALGSGRGHLSIQQNSGSGPLI